MKGFPNYSAADYAALTKKYTPAQLAAIAAGEAAISPAQLAAQAVLRRDPMALPYLDDLAARQAYIDRKPQPPARDAADVPAHRNRPMRLRDETEEVKEGELGWRPEAAVARDLDAWRRGIAARDRARPPEAVEEDEGEDGDADADDTSFERRDWRRFEESASLLRGPDGKPIPTEEFAGDDGWGRAVAPQLPKIDDPALRDLARQGKQDVSDDELRPAFERVARTAKLDVEWLRGLRTKILVHRRVTNQTRMGKVAKTYYLVVAGDGKGLLGLGEGKGAEIEDAKRQALMNAIRNLTPVPRYERRTIFGDVKGKVGATELELFTRPPGTYPPSSFHRSHTSLRHLPSPLLSNPYILFQRTRGRRLTGV